MGIRTRGIDWLFWVLMGIIVFGIWALSWAKPPLQTLGFVISLGTYAVIVLGFLGLDKVLLRAARWFQRVRQGR